MCVRVRGWGQFTAGFFPSAPTGRYSMVRLVHLSSPRPRPPRPNPSCLWASFHGNKEYREVGEYVSVRWAYISLSGLAHTHTHTHTHTHPHTHTHRHTFARKHRRAEKIYSNDWKTALLDFWISENGTLLNLDSKYPAIQSRMQHEMVDGHSDG